MTADEKTPLISKSESSESKNGSLVPSARLFPSARLAISFMLMLGGFCTMLNFYAVNFAMACMVNATYVNGGGPTGEENDQANHSASACAVVVHEATEGYKGTFLWTRADQANVLAGVAIGAVAFQFVGGTLMDLVGPKIPYIVCLLVYAVSAALTPVAAYTGWAWLMVIRIIQGLALVTNWPAVLVVSNMWYPASEYASLQSISTCGNQLGGLTAMGITALFCTTVGWEGTFYLTAGISLAVALIFMIFFHSPERTPFISAKERAYILSTRRRGVVGNKRRIPWFRMLTSVPVIALTLSFLFTRYMYYFIGDFLPTYYKEYLGIATSADGIYSALPYLSQFLGRLTSGPLSDLTDKWVGITWSIRIFTVISTLFPAILYMIVPVFDCTQVFGPVILVTLGYYFYAFMVGSTVKSISCIGPDYTGAIAGISQTAGYAAAVSAPYITSVLVPHSSPEEWRTAFLLAGGLGVLGTVIFLIGGTGEVQDWAKPDEEIAKGLQTGSTDSEGPISA